LIYYSVKVLSFDTNIIKVTVFVVFATPVESHEYCGK
jgi:hypothetical protein